MRARIAFVAVAAVGLVLASCGGSAEPFDFATDDLCERVSAEQVAGFVEAAYGWEATAVEKQPVYDEWDCWWELTGTDDADGAVYAGRAEWFDFDGVPIVLSDQAGGRVVDFADLGEASVPIGVAVSGHPSLSEGVVAFNGGFGSFAFGVPPADQYLQIGIHVPVGGDDEWTVAEPKFFAVADGFVEALGWLPER